jgi:hypothetical protein
MPGFVGLVLPHAQHGSATSVPETGNQPGVAFEMALQCCPFRRKKVMHGGIYYKTGQRRPYRGY